jgi:DNA repair protein RecO (recombination protein O)
MAMGEADWLMTILTREYGLVRAIAKGARKATARIGGRIELLVVNDLQLYKGRNLDQIFQADCLRSFRGLSAELSRLAAAQYLAEGVLLEATEGQPQEILFDLLLLHLERLAGASVEHLPARLVHGIYQLLTISGVAPEVYSCTVSHRPISAEAASFSIEGGGLVALECSSVQDTSLRRLDLQQVSALQLLAADDLPTVSLEWSVLWMGIERLLRRYLEFHFDRTIHSADLLDLCFEIPSAAMGVPYNQFLSGL